MRAALGSVQRHIRELSEEKEAARQEVAELRRTVAEQTEYLHELAANVRFVLGRDDDLKSMLMSAHQQIMNRADEIRSTLTAELQQQAALQHRNAFEQNIPSNAPASVRTDTHGFIPSMPSKHAGYQHLGKHGFYQQLIREIRFVVHNALPSDGTVIVASKGDDALLNLEGKRGWHFPQTEDGEYVGYHPADSAEATARLEELRAKGGEFLLFPATAFWWLEYYPEFKQHLDARYNLIWSDARCIIYGLSEPRQGGEEGK